MSNKIENKDHGKIIKFRKENNVDEEDNVHVKYKFEQWSYGEDAGEQGIATRKKKKNKFKISIVTIIFIVLIFLAFLVIGKHTFVKLVGGKSITVEYGEQFDDPGIHAISIKGNLSKDVVKIGNVDTSKLGSYMITYKVPSGNSYRSCVRTVNVVDTKAPEITLNGDSYCKLSYGTEYQEPGFSANDNYDGDLTGSVTSNRADIDENNYEIHYIVKDSSGNRGESIRHIEITDDVAPKISLKGNSMVCVLVGNDYQEQGATAEDNKDGDLTSKIITSGNVDTSKEGTYSIDYAVSDTNGNKAECHRKVIVSTKETTGVIYLTFDDGPSTSTTPKILDILKEKGVKATFFVINYSDSTEYLLKREVDEGHAIGIHGYSHDYAKIYASVDTCYNNIIDLQQRIYKATGVTSKIVRFPGGSSNTVSRKYCPGIMTEITKKVLSEGFKYYDWNVASGDSGDVKTKEGVYNNVTSGLKAGRNNIVLMHDFSGNNKTIEALPEIIDYGIANGYVFDVITPETEMVTQKIQN